MPSRSTLMRSARHIRLGHRTAMTTTTRFPTATIHRPYSAASPESPHPPTCNCDCDHDSSSSSSLPPWPSSKFNEPIDRSSRLLKIAPYNHHLLFLTPTGSHEWPSKPPPDSIVSRFNTLYAEKLSAEEVISDDGSGKWKGGKVLVNQITPCTHRIAKEDGDGDREVQVIHFPSGRIHTIPTISHDFDTHSPSSSASRTDEAIQSILSNLNRPDDTVSERRRRRGGPLILICGHLSRDSRCGHAAPVLKRHMEHYLSTMKFRRRHEDGGVLARGEQEEEQEEEGRVEVMYVDHMGGHKFAGNCIFYLPPSHLYSSSTSRSISPLPSDSDCDNVNASSDVTVEEEWSAVWYGRVDTHNVQEILDRTLRYGRRVEKFVRYGTGRFAKPSSP